ncbi:MAG: hypothetical protein AAF485_19800 [Chloroflexota bacterium]
MNRGEAVIREVIELHQFFEGWLSGTLPNTEENFQRVAQVLAETFTMVSPAGEELDQPPMINYLRDGWGARSSLKIWVDQCRILNETPELIVARYEEWQQVAGGEETVRVSTAVFRDAPDTPNGVTWLHVHETWATSAKR